MTYDDIRPAYRLEELRGLKSESDVQNNRIYDSSLKLLYLMFAAWVLSKLPIPGFNEIIVVNPVLLNTWAWSMGRADFLMHRLAPFLAKWGIWESSPERKNKKELLLVYDLGTMAAFLFFAYESFWASWGLPQWRIYTMFTGFLFLLALAGILYAAFAFKVPKQTEGS